MIVLIEITFHLPCLFNTLYFPHLIFFLSDWDVGQSNLTKAERIFKVIRLAPLAIDHPMGSHSLTKSSNRIFLSKKFSLVCVLFLDLHIFTFSPGLYYIYYGSR